MKQEKSRTVVYLVELSGEVSAPGRWLVLIKDSGRVRWVWCLHEVIKWLFTCLPLSLCRTFLTVRFLLGFSPLIGLGLFCSVSSFSGGRSGCWFQSFFSDMCVYNYKSPSTALAASYKFWSVAFSFSFISKCFLIFLVISSLILGIFWSVLINFHIFMNYQYFLLLLIFNFIPLWPENMLF